MAHSLLIVLHCILTQNSTYEELGGGSLDRIHAEGHKRYLVKKLEALGFRVNLVPPEQGG